MSKYIKVPIKDKDIFVPCSILKKLWSDIYPDRRDFDLLEDEAKSEWALFYCKAVRIYLDNPTTIS